MLTLMPVCAGAETVQQLIDAGAYVCFKDENGIEMVAEYTREVGLDVVGTKTFEAKRDRFFVIYICLRSCA